MAVETHHDTLHGLHLPASAAPAFRSIKPDYSRDQRLAACFFSSKPSPEGPAGGGSGSRRSFVQTWLRDSNDEPVSRSTGRARNAAPTTTGSIFAGFPSLAHTGAVR